jgi:hypothetical protein
LFKNLFVFFGRNSTLKNRKRMVLILKSILFYQMDQ